MDEFILKVDNEIVSGALIKRSESGTADVIVALSGGADSVALLVSLNNLGYKCVAAHCNFHLRGEESNRDMNFSKETASLYAIEFKCIHFNVEDYKKKHGVSIEMACRDLRYDWFRKLSAEYGGIPVAIAHHRDDNEETFFLNILRGTGISGLCGMKRRNGIFIRPLLGTSRNEIISFLSHHSINYITDSSNLENDVKRNKLRNIILPSLRAQFPNADIGILHTISDIGRNYGLYHEAVQMMAAKFVDGRNEIDVLSLSKEIKNASMLLYEMIREKGFTFSQACDMIEHPCGSGRTFYSRDYHALLNRGKLIIMPKTDDHPECIEFHIGESYESIPLQLSIRFIDKEDMQPDRSGLSLYLDGSILADSPLFTLREWKAGDRIHPFGMRGSRLVSDILTDAKIPLNEKHKIKVLEANGKILWVIGLRTSRHYPITENTSSVLFIRWNESQ